MRLVCVAILCALVAPVDARMPRRLPPPLTLAPLTWDMSVEQARTALERSKMEPKYAETRRYMAREPGESGPIVHTSEPGFSFTPRKGWHGTAHFDWNDSVKDYRIDRIVAYAEGLSDGALKDELAALSSQNGTPGATKPNQHIWVQGGTWLVAAFTKNEDTKRWTLYVNLRLDPTPLPAP